MKRSGSIAALVFLFAGCADPAPSVPTFGTHVADWRDEVIYQIVTDRFANGDTTNDSQGGIDIEPRDLARHQGGDYRGIEQHLDYIEALGATALWISPIVRNVDRTEEADGYHGYWASDFTELNPRFGTLEDLRSLVGAAHLRDMKVIVDVVTNHAGRVFDYDLDGDGRVEDGEPEPPFRADRYDAPLVWSTRTKLFGPDGQPFELDDEHFHRQGQATFTDVHAMTYGDFPSGLRDLATSRDDVIDALVATYAHWVLATDVDGFRIDAVPMIEPEFWPRFCRDLREKLAAAGKTRFLLLGEVFTGDGSQIAPYLQRDALDTVLDFPLKFGVIDDIVLSGRSPSRARPILEGNREMFGAEPQPMGVEITPWQARVAFADNHDVWRLRSELDDPAAAAIALAIVFTVDAIPLVYYGTEQDMRGEDHHAARAPLWDAGYGEEGATFRFIASLAAARREHEALRRGSLTVRYASENDGLSDARDAGILAYERATERDRVLLVVNVHALKPSSADVPTGFAPGTVLRDQLGERTVTVQDDGTVPMTLVPRGAHLLAPR